MTTRDSTASPQGITAGPHPAINGTPVLLALSGGVDSAVAAHLLRQQGYAVQGLVIRFSPAHDTAVAAAQAAAAELGIPLHIAHCEESFHTQVIQPFCAAYSTGRTPNPCVVCNPLVKFAMLRQMANDLGIYHIASGHYAQIISENGVYYVAMAASTRRDQSYMLYRLPQDILSRLLLPVGALEKPAIRAIAAGLGISSATTPDSQDICFIPDGDYPSYIESAGYPSAQGRFVGPAGQDFGPHRGVVHYTVGQRKGLGVSAAKPLYVQAITPGGNVLLAHREDTFARAVTLSGAVFSGGIPHAPLSVKIRSMAQPVPCQVHYDTAGLPLRIDFETPRSSPAPGQHAVLYAGSRVIGGGAIETVVRQHSSNSAERGD